MSNSTTTACLTPRSRNGKAKSELVLIPPRDLIPASDNDLLYRPINTADPEFRGLVESIREHGVLEPLVITSDQIVVSGHRRRAAALVAKLKRVPCRVLPMASDDPRFVQVLREYNRQRVKTLDEMLHEAIVETAADRPDIALEMYRENRSARAMRADTMELRDQRDRARISKAKRQFLDAVLQVLDDLADVLPVSDRRIHYALLNDPPLIHASKAGSRYSNTPQSYRALCDLLTRARIAGIIPMDAIADETRPVETWNVHRSARPFVRAELDSFLRGYFRDYMQSQPNHIEIVGEKSTLAGTVRPIAAKYCIPMTLGRGFCSLPPRHAIAQRFRKSGKDALVLLMLSDFDPDGEVIAESFARSLRDDFRIDNIHAVKVALTRDQTRQTDLPPALKAKTASRRGKLFVEQHGHDVWELEALRPDVLQELLEEAIVHVLDIDAYNAEVEAEAADVQFLYGARQRAKLALQGIMEDQPDGQ